MVQFSHCVNTDISLFYPLNGKLCSAQNLILIDSFTVSSHSPSGRQMPAVRAAQGDCQWLLINSGNSHQSHDPTIHCNYGNPSQCLDQSIQKAANWRPFCLSHWQFLCHQASSVGCVTVYDLSQMKSPLWGHHLRSTFFSNPKTAKFFFKM